jgi:hypothetical protein
MIRDAGFAGAGVRFIDPDFAGEVTSFLRDHGNLTCAVLPDRRRRSETGAGCTATPACSRRAGANPPAELPRRYCAEFCGRTSLDNIVPRAGNPDSRALFSDREVSPPSLTSLPVVVRILFAGQMYTLRSLSNLKSSRLKVPSSRFDLSITSGYAERCACL